MKYYITNLRLAGDVLHCSRSVLVYIISQKSCVCVKRKGAQAARKVPPDFDAVKAAFLERVSEAATVEHLLVPPQLIVNLIKLVQNLSQ